MGTLRLYSNRYRAMDVGDPFSLRVPKKLRKLKVGRFLGRAVAGVTSLIPGVGGVFGSLLSQIANKYGVDESQLAGFARQYGIDVGDPAGQPPRRQRAAQTPKSKAKAKSKARAAPKKQKTKPGQPSRLQEAGSAVGTAVREAAGGNIGAAMGEILKQANLGHITQGRPIQIPGMHGAGGRRRINPTNVKALRRGIRRIESFERIVKSVQKAYPRIARATAGRAQGRGARGHRSGCGCAVCRRVA